MTSRSVFQLFLATVVPWDLRALTEGALYVGAGRVWPLSPGSGWAELTRWHLETWCEVQASQVCQ